MRQAKCGVCRCSPNRRRGAETIEFTLVLLPLLCLLFVTMDVAWAIFAKATLNRAVRVGVRVGATTTAAQTPAGTCLTEMVKAAVQTNSLGLLGGSSGLSKIKVNYLQPPDSTSTGPAVDVSGLSNGNQPGNIIQVSIQNYPLLPLFPRIFGWNEAPDNQANNISAASADRIEPSRNPPCIGTAP